MAVSALLPGDPQRLGTYRVLARLGAGGMGVVLLAVDPTGTAVAVKLVRPDLAGPAEARARFIREVETLRLVRGPNVAAVLDADLQRPQPFLVTRFIPGPRLDEAVETGGALRLPAYAVLGRGLARALGAMHAAGIVHRDLTPGNVLLADDEPVVIDFGIARAVELTGLTSTGFVLGTAGYLAPEQVVRGESSVASDVWAWGATMAYAGTSRPPFGVGRPEAVLYRVVHEEPDLAGLPPALAGTVRAALHPDADRRPPVAALLAACTELADDHHEAVRRHSGPPRPAEEHLVDPDAHTGRLSVADAPAEAGTSRLPVLDGPASSSLRRDAGALAPAGSAVSRTPDATSHIGPAPIHAVKGEPGHHRTAVLPRPLVGPLPDRAPTAPPRAVGPPAAEDSALFWLGDVAPESAPRPPAGSVPVPPPLSSRPSRLGVGSVLALLALLGLLGAAAASVPFVAGPALGVLIVLLHLLARAREAQALRRLRRGPRRRDAALTVLGLPAYLLHAIVDTLLALLPAAAVGSATALLVVLGAQSQLPATTAIDLGTGLGAAVTAVVALLGWRGQEAAAAGRTVLRPLTGGPWRAMVVLVVLLGAAGVASAYLGGPTSPGQLVSNVVGRLPSR